MRTLALSLLACQALAQVTVPRPTTTENPSEETPTNTLVPEETGEPCAAISRAISRSNADNVAVDAKVAYDCLQSVPLLQSAAEATIDGIINMVQFQSTLGFLNNPPDDYANAPVDLVTGLQDIRTAVGNGDYAGEFEFEAAIAQLLGRAYDGHLAFDGYAFSGAFRWRRDPQAGLISATTGDGLPQVYAARDARVNERSPVTQINGRPVLDVIAEEAAANSYHDADARWNAMFVLQPAESSGFFISPRFYPGPDVSLTFENGTTSTFQNAAIVQDAESWGRVTDGRTFYNTFVQVQSTTIGKRELSKSKHRTPTRLQIPRDADLTQTLARDGSVPETYPDPFVEHPAIDVPLAGFFIDTPNIPNVGVLMIQTFNTVEVEDSQQFQRVMQDFIAEAQSRGTERIIIDVRTNGGGKIFLGYEAFKQFFPGTEPFGGSRYRYHDGADILGKSLSTIEYSSFMADLFTSPFNYHSYLDQELNDFTSWEDMSGPVTHNGDEFTNILRYNLSDSLLVESERFGLGIELTGYGSRSNFTEAPFPPENIIILSDGICASTCAIFTELMTRQSDVRTFTIGGRPQPGPMQAVGGTKGSSVIFLDYFITIGSYVINEFATSRQEAADWLNKLPLSFGITPSDASVNFQDAIRQGTEDTGVPTQFINDTSSCRLYYSPEMYFDVEQVWSAVAETVWGNGGQLDESRCVGGSRTDETSQVGNIDSGNNDEQGGNGNGNGGDGEGAAAALGPRGWLVVSLGMVLSWMLLL